MSLSINLLPDLRQAKLRESHRRQLVTGISVAVWVICAGIVGLLAVYAAGQKVIIGAKTQSINTKKHQLEGVPNLINALTADQHLVSLPGLYDKRVYLTKFFTAYSDVDPVGTVVESLAVDSSNVLTVRGLASTYSEVAKLARSLQAANVKVGTGAAESNTPYFTDVSIQSVENQSKAVSFSIVATMGSGVTSASN